MNRSHAEGQKETRSGQNLHDVIRDQGSCWVSCCQREYCSSEPEETARHLPVQNMSSVSTSPKADNGHWRLSKTSLGHVWQRELFWQTASTHGLSEIWRPLLWPELLFLWFTKGMNAQDSKHYQCDTSKKSVGNWCSILSVDIVEGSVASLSFEGFENAHEGQVWIEIRKFLQSWQIAQT